MTNNLFKQLSKFMDIADEAYQQDQYSDLNKAFPHLNNLYEVLQDQNIPSDVEQVVDEVLEEQKYRKLHTILDEIEKHKKDILESDNKTSIIQSQGKIIELLQKYILIDSDIHQ